MKKSKLAVAVATLLISAASGSTSSATPRNNKFSNAKDLVICAGFYTVAAESTDVKVKTTISDRSMKVDVALSELLKATGLNGDDVTSKVPPFIDNLRSVRDTDADQFTRLVMATVVKCDSFVRKAKSEVRAIEHAARTSAKAKGVQARMAVTGRAKADRMSKARDAITKPADNKSGDAEKQLGVRKINAEEAEKQPTSLIGRTLATGCYDGANQIFYGPDYRIVIEGGKTVTYAEHVSYEFRKGEEWKGGTLLVRSSTSGITEIFDLNAFGFANFTGYEVDGIGIAAAQISARYTCENKLDMVPVFVDPPNETPVQIGAYLAIQENNAKALQEFINKGAEVNKQVFGSSLRQLAKGKSYAIISMVTPEDLPKPVEPSPDDPDVRDGIPGILCTAPAQGLRLMVFMEDQPYDEQYRGYARSYYRDTMGGLSVPLYQFVSATVEKIINKDERIVDMIKNRKWAKACVRALSQSY